MLLVPLTLVIVFYRKMSEIEATPVVEEPAGRNGHTQVVTEMMRDSRVDVNARDTTRVRGGLRGISLPVFVSAGGRECKGGLSCNSSIGPHSA